MNRNRPSGQGRWCVLALMVGVLGTGSPADAGALPSPGCLDGGTEAEVAAVGPGLEIHLADGRDLLLAGVDSGLDHERADEEAARVAAERWLKGRTVLVHILSNEADRWNRWPALVFASPPRTDLVRDSVQSRVSVTEALLDAGLARAKPDQRIESCWTGFLHLESVARDAALGLWKEPGYAVIAADDRARLHANTGRLAIVSGRVVEIRDGRARTYLRLGQPGRNDFAVMVEQKTMLRLRSAGLDVRTWRGRDIRVRGFLDDRFGMQIELTSRDQIEFTGPGE